MAGASSKAQAEERTIVWVDESAFYPLPAVVRTWAPCGVTPSLHALLTRDHLSVISGITPTGQLLLQMRDRSLRGPDVVRFLQHLLRHVPGKLLVIWAGAAATSPNSGSNSAWRLPASAIGPPSSKAASRSAATRCGAETGVNWGVS
jgi:hypothetical protein